MEFEKVSKVKELVTISDLGGPLGGSEICLGGRGRMARREGWRREDARGFQGVRGRQPRARYYRGYRWDN